MSRFGGHRVHAWVAMAARWYLGGVFLFACVHKIAAPAAFALDIATYQVLPLSLVNLLAITLPWVELAAGVSLVTGFKARGGAMLAGAMMLMFLVALGIALARGLELACGCFASGGVAADPISWRTVARDVVWLGIAIYVVIVDRRPIGVDRLWRRGVS